MYNGLGDRPDAGASSESTSTLPGSPSSAAAAVAPDCRSSRGGSRGRRPAGAAGRSDQFAVSATAAESVPVPAELPTSPSTADGICLPGRIVPGAAPRFVPSLTTADKALAQLQADAGKAAIAAAASGPATAIPLGLVLAVVDVGGNTGTAIVPAMAPLRVAAATSPAAGIGPAAKLHFAAIGGDKPATMTVGSDMTNVAGKFAQQQPTTMTAAVDGSDCETIDLSMKRRTQQSPDPSADDIGALSLVKYPRSREPDVEDLSSIPLNLTKPRVADGVQPSVVGGSPSEKVADGTEVSERGDTASPAASDSGSATPAAAAAVASSSSLQTSPVPLTSSLESSSSVPNSQILLLSGKQYEIVPLGEGRWISRNEYELLRGLGMASCSGRGAATKSSPSPGDMSSRGVESHTPGDAVESAPLSATATTTKTATLAAEEVSSTNFPDGDCVESQEIVLMSTSGETNDEDEEEGRLQIALDDSCETTADANSPAVTNAAAADEKTGLKDMTKRRFPATDCDVDDGPAKKRVKIDELAAVTESDALPSDIDKLKTGLSSAASAVKVELNTETVTAE